ncbi:hypothetical protein RHMOL_Rhmol10G0267900 [Rhododendron molle]|uniref:Uncharacterized protein n=1 Tax=Rhododendron molle TaxID=49168 RepID=A0ACC0M831_RHOML|nr:hypothetical protein RHMOL_Rhmol10G0267900 [Rhododendron molle]
MLEIQNCDPPWLRQLLKANFYLVCQIHKDYKCNRCNRFCINCTGNPFCGYCLDDHKNHQIIQTRRSSLSNGVRVDDINKYINVGDVQAYTINRRQIVFLNSRPYTGLPHGVTNICTICRRGLPADKFKFCCLSCKHEAISHGFARQTFAVGTELSAGKMDDSFQVDESSTSDRKSKVRRLDKSVAKSSVASPSVTKQVTGNIYPASASVSKHANFRKRKGIPRRAPLM